MRSRLAALIIAVLFAVPCAAAVTEDVAAFAKLPQFSNVEISPDGSRIAGLVTIEGKRAIYTLEIGTGKPKVMTADDQWHLSWIDWVDNRYVLVGIKTPFRRGGVATVETRLVSFDSNTGSGKILFTRHMHSIERKGGVIPQFQDDVLHLLPERDEEFIIAFDKRGSGGEAVYVANARTGSLGKKLQSVDPYVTQWRVDASGDVRVGWGIARDKTSFTYKIKDGEGEWHDHSERYNADGFRVAELPVDGTGHVLVLSDHEYPLGALYRFDPVSATFVELVAQHDESEISRVRLSADGSAIESVHYSSEFVPNAYMDTRLDATIKGVQNALPDLRLFPVSRSLDSTRIVMRSYASNKAPGYYLYDANKKSVGPITSRYPELIERDLSRPGIHSFEARDGLEITAYVTLPAGLTADTADHIPFVVSVHGGPNARDFLRFDWETQMLAARGYGVLQINFRGSTGYGRAFREAGDREWGQAMQDDVADGTRWAIAQGWADPERVCIIGGSYGGYAALMGAARDGDLYRCAASLNGVSDLPALLKRSYRYVGGRARTRHIGRLYRDRDQLRAASPVNLVEAVDMPILLVHGEKDRVVDVRQSRKMARALERNGKPVQYIELPEGTHSLERESNRLDYATALVEFLDTHLAAPSDAAAQHD
ncbi:MAG: S9 family peptidase [Pseudomonadota bacterium]